MKKISLIFTTLICIQFINAQNVGIGQWKDYLSYRSGISVAEGGGKVYCATKTALFVLNKSDNSIERLSKINGLSDVEPTVINYNKYSGNVLVAYKNSNIDIIESNGTIVNLADIKRKPIQGNKSINNIYFINQYAYLACGFGIVVIDMDKQEVSDTYYIGPNGNSLNVRDITSDDINFYAATDLGIYTAPRNSPNLANFSSWSVMPGLPTGIYNTIAKFKGKLFTNFSKFLTNGSYYQDTAYVYNGISWSYLIPTNGLTIRSLKNCNDTKLVMTQPAAVTTYDSMLVAVDYYSGYFSDITRAEETIIDNTNNVWIADDKYGLVNWKPGVGFNHYFPDGPSSSNVTAMSIQEDNLAVTPGTIGSYYADGVYLYNGSTWNNVKGSYPPIVSMDTLVNINNVFSDPNDAKRVYASTGLAGVLELYDGVPVQLYNSHNSSLQALTIPGYTPVWTSGIAMDAENNLWIANSGVPSSISVKKTDDTWQALNFSSIIGNAPNLGQVLVDKNDQKWVILTGSNGIMVYNGAGDTPNLTNTKKMTSAVGSGALPSTNVTCLAEDVNGEIWVGTDKGIAVFYSPESIFSGDNFDSQQILLEQDGHVQILLLTELVQAIAVDDANRKWIGTLNSGVFLMSADGTQQIYHFDASNSPLFDNSVKSIVINHKTGEVYFGTNKGIISFRGTSTAGQDYFTDVYSFPNPVKHNYEGPIAIKGLVNNTTVKITDVNGTLVYQTLSEGGQAIWNGKNFNGERVSTGVYMVFCTNEDGTQKIMTKILFIN